MLATAVGITGLMAMGGIGAGVASADRPANCAEGYYRSVCANPIVNNTKGFTAGKPGQPSVAAGFPLTFARWEQVGYGYDQGHSASIAPGGSGYASSRNTGGWITGTSGNYYYTIGGSLAGQGVSEVGFYMSSPISGSNSTQCLNATYVGCSFGKERGSSKDPIWTVDLYTRPLVLRIDNFVDQPLQLEGGIVDNNLLRQPVADQNVSSIPSGNGVAYLGALLAIDQEASLDVVYRVGSGGTGEFTGASVNIHVAIPTSGKSEGSTCEITNRSSAGVLRCDVQPFTVIKDGIVSVVFQVR